MAGRRCKVIRPNDETRSVRGNGFQEAKQNTNAATITPAEKIGNPAYLIAKLALAGHSVHRGNNRDFLVSRWGMTHYCETLESLQAFADRVGVKP